MNRAWCYLTLLAVTLLADVATIRFAYGSHDTPASYTWSMALLFSMAYTQVTLVAVAATAPRFKFRWLMLLLLPVVSGAAGMGFGYGLAGWSREYFVYLAMLFMATGVIVTIVLGAVRIWQAIAGDSTDKSEWQFNIRHFCVAAIVVALIAGAMRGALSQFEDREWPAIVIYIINFALVAIVCGLILQPAKPNWSRLGAATVLCLAIGWVFNFGPGDFSDYGGVRMNAIAVAQLVAWMWHPQLTQRESMTLNQPARG